MNAPDDRMLTEADLGTHGILGFRIAMRRSVQDRTRSMDDARLRFSDDAVRLAGFERGVRIAGAFRRLRPRASAMDTATARPARTTMRGADRDAAMRVLIEACATADGFTTPDPHLAWRMANQVRPSDVGYYERDVVTFHDEDGPNGILSPTHPTLIVHESGEWSSVEALYQAQKHLDPDFREAIRTAPDALTAKALAKTRSGDATTMRDQFGPGRRVAMVRAQMLRVTQDDAFRAALIATGGRDIVEHDHHAQVDTRWGAVGTGGLRGWNMQGRILSTVRTAVTTGLLPAIRP